MSPSYNNDTIQIGNDEQALEATTREQLIDKIVADRADQWTATINAELQSLITQAAEIRKNLSSAKTQTKKNYYQKKFNKVSVQVRQMIAALQRVQSTTANNLNEPQPNDVDTVAAE